MTQHQMSAQQSENRIQKWVKTWGLSNILTIVAIAISGFAYLNSKFDTVIDSVVTLRVENATIKTQQANMGSAISEIKTHQVEQDKIISEDHNVIFGRLLTHR